MATETDTTHIDDDDDADPRASPFPPSHLAAPRYVAVAAAITAPPRRRTCFHARSAPWEMRAQGQSCCVSRERCHVAILNSSRDHRRGFVRRVAARKLKFHVKRILLNVEKAAIFWYIIWLMANPFFNRCWLRRFGKGKHFVFLVPDAFYF